MLRVGLTGGIASGKGVIANELARLGCHVIHADELGHEVLLPTGEAYQPVLDEFGPHSILAPDGNGDGSHIIDRKKLAAVVFTDPARLARLNAIVHPAVRRLGDAKSAAIAAADPHGILVYEAAILVETGGYRNFDKLIVAACPESIQIERAMARDGSTREEAAARIARQLPLADKVRHADFIVDTGGSLEQTLNQTRITYEALRGLADRSRR